MLQFIAALLIGQVQIISEPSREPALAAAECQCSPGEPCQCGANCTCHPVTVAKPVISVVKVTAPSTTKKPDISDEIVRSQAKTGVSVDARSPPRRQRIDPQSPPTIAPDPDYDVAIAAFTERHKDGVAKVYVGPKLTEQPAAVTRASPSGPPVGAARPPAYEPPQIDRDHMTRVFTGYTCDGGQCVARYEWRPQSQSPTVQAQAPLPQPIRRGLFGRRAW